MEWLIESTIRVSIVALVNRNVRWTASHKGKKFM